MLDSISQDAIERAELATDGNRNDALNRAAFTIGGRVGAGECSYEEAKAELMALGSRLNEEHLKLKNTVLSGLESGQQKPLHSRQKYRPRKQATVGAASSKRTPSEAILPVPDNVQDYRSIRHHQLGQPIRYWEYLNEQGQLEFVIARFETDDGKAIRPLSFGSKEKNWCWRRPHKMIPWNLPEAINSPEKTILICEGEKAAEAAKELAPNYAVSCGHGGAQQPHMTDWSSLKDRQCLIMPDDDEPSISIWAPRLSELLVNLDSTVRVIDPFRFWQLSEDESSSGHDAADFTGTSDEFESILGQVSSESESLFKLAVADLVEFVGDDPGAAFMPQALAALSEAKSEDLPEFERLRKQIGSSARLTALDKALADFEGSDREPEFQTDVLLDLAAQATLFTSMESTAFADITISNHRQTWPVRSTEFRQWLIREYYFKTDQAPNNESLGNVLNVLEAKARFDSPQQPVFQRVGEYQDKIYLDLGDDTWDTIEITDSGWAVVSESPVHFRRNEATQSLPRPERGGSIDLLKSFLNLTSEEDFVLIVSWILAALKPSGPYPVLVIQGEQGSAKSTFCEIIRSLVDPNTALLRAPPREDRDLFIAAKNSRVVAFDNLSKLSPWLSDTLCRLATGGGFATRALYTNEEEILFNISCPIILNGIDDFVERADLADRTVVIGLKTITPSARKPKAQLSEEYEKASTLIFGAILDGLTTGLRNLPHTKLDTAPRMADFALWATACETAYWQAGTFLNAYSENLDESSFVILDEDPLYLVIRSLLTIQPSWKGTATDLWLLPENKTELMIYKKTGWPKNHKILGKQLHRLAPNLRKVGIEAKLNRSDTQGSRIWTIRKSNINPT